MRFRILGPLEIVENGSPLQLGANKPRALLAVLLLARGEAVTSDRLIDALWGDEPPPSAAKSVQVYVSQLRKVLGDRLETRGKGYALRVEREELDAACFEMRLEHGRERLAAGDADAAAAVLREALALWRGPALADMAYESFAQPEIARLEELRLAALEERIDADLALGRHDALTGELEGLIREHPLRERLQGQLMLALYGSGRQVDALERYQRARRALVDQLGIEPGPALQEVHAAVLRQDPELTTTARAGARVQARRRSGLLIAAGGAVVGLTAIAAALSLSWEPDVPDLPPVTALAESRCSPLQRGGGGAPDVLVVSDQELGGPVRSIGNQMAAATEFVVRRRGFRAGPHAIGYQACDGTEQKNSIASTCARNARQYAGNRALVGVIGPTASGCAREQISIANRAPGGPLAMISPSNTAVGLTRPGPGTETREPGVYYPSGIRNYVRLMPADDLQGAAHALLAERLGARRAYVVQLDGGGTVGDTFKAAAERLGIEIVGQGVPENYEVMRRVREEAMASRPDTVFIAGGLPSGGDIVLSELRPVLGRDVIYLGPDGFSVPEIREAAALAEGMIVSVPGLAPNALPDLGARTVEQLSEELGRPPHQYAVYAAQATELLLDAIARSDGTRASVVRELFATDVKNGILGDFAVTETGDTTATQVTMYDVVNGRLRFREVLRPPVNLLAGG